MREQVAGRPPATIFWGLSTFAWAGLCASLLVPAAAAGRPRADLIALMLIYAAGLLVSALLLRPAVRAAYLRIRVLPLLLATVVAISAIGSVLWAWSTDIVIVRWLSTEVGVVSRSREAAIFVWMERFVVLTVWCGFYLMLVFWGDLQDKKVRVVESSAQAQLAHARMLRYQLNPHFFFNALNSLRALIQSDAARASTMIGELSAFLRHSLLEESSDDVPLAREIASLRHYLAIEKIRFEDRLDAQIVFDERLGRLRVPPLVLQPLVENAVKHGMRTSTMPLAVRIDVASDGRCLRAAVRNSGTLTPSTSDGSHAGGGVGLRNVRQRLRERFPGSHRCTLRADGATVLAVLEIDLDALAP